MTVIFAYGVFLANISQEREQRSFEFFADQKACTLVLIGWHGPKLAVSFNTLQGMS